VTLYVKYLLFACMFKHYWATRVLEKRLGGPKKSWKSPGILESKRVETMCTLLISK